MSQTKNGGLAGQATHGCSAAAAHRDPAKPNSAGSLFAIMNGSHYGFRAEVSQFHYVVTLF
jgi:hypothetical protein